MDAGATVTYYRGGFHLVASVGYRVAAMSRPYDLSYGFTSDTYGLIQWRWNVEDRDKVFHQTWKPKQSDIQILDTHLTPEEIKEITLEIIIDIQSELKRI